MLLREGDRHTIRKFECHMEVAVTGLGRMWGWVLPGFLEAEVSGRWVPSLEG